MVLLCCAVFERVTVNSWLGVWRLAFQGRIYFTEVMGKSKASNNLKSKRVTRIVNPVAVGSG
jgi:hypothetical protein